MMKGNLVGMKKFCVSKKSGYLLSIFIRPLHGYLIMVHSDYSHFEYQNEILVTASTIVRYVLNPGFEAFLISTVKFTINNTLRLIYGVTKNYATN